MTTDKKSDTPRTDAAEAHNASLQLVGGRVLADFARQLERELNEALSRIKIIQEENEYLKDEIAVID